MEPEDNNSDEGWSSEEGQDSDDAEKYDLSNYVEPVLTSQVSITTYSQD